MDGFLLKTVRGFLWFYFWNTFINFFHLGFHVGIFKPHVFCAGQEGGCLCAHLLVHTPHHWV